MYCDVQFPRGFCAAIIAAGSEWTSDDVGFPTNVPPCDLGMMMALHKTLRFHQNFVGSSVMLKAKIIKTDRVIQAHFTIYFVRARCTRLNKQG